MTAIQFVYGIPKELMLSEVISEFIQLPKEKQWERRTLMEKALDASYKAEALGLWDAFTRIFSTNIPGFFANKSVNRPIAVPANEKWKNVRNANQKISYIALWQLGWSSGRRNTPMGCGSDLPTPGRNDLFFNSLNLASHSRIFAGFFMLSNMSMRLSPRYTHGCMWHQLVEFYSMVESTPRGNARMGLLRTLRDLIGVGIIIGSLQCRYMCKDEFFKVLAELFLPNTPEDFSVWSIGFHRGLQKQNLAMGAAPFKGYI